tara:strand:- start:817 stop:1065 length:249 start_codon:yes stop_codon:yes gene_type:complete
VQELQRESTKLLARKLSDGLSDREERRLAVLTWHLDRYDMARMGPQLDALEARVQTHEAIARSVSRLVEVLTNAQPKSTKPR